MPNLKAAGSHTVDEIFACAKDHPFYREKLQGVASFADAGLTDKKELYAVINKTFESDGDCLKGVYWSPTGGSVSEFLLFYPTDPAENHYQRRLLAEHLIAAKIFTPDTVALNLFGSTLMYRSLEIFNEYCEVAGATALPVSSVCPDEVACKIATRFAANTVMGLPSRILQFARYLARESISIIFEDVVFAGEPLPEHKKEFLRRTIGAKRFSGLYGSAEAGVWAFQSDQMAADLGISADAYLFPKQLMHVEIAAADGDGYGNIVTTNLVRTRHPLLRYDSGDVGRMVLSSKCPRECRLLELRGRTERSFEIGGEYYALDDFVGLFAEAGLLEYQIVLTFDPAKQMDLVSFFLVAGPAAEVKAVKLAITSGIRKIVQSNDASFITEINFVESETLARSKTGQKVLKIVDSRPK